MDSFLVVLLPELASHVHVVVSESFADSRGIQPPVDINLPAADLGEYVNHLLDFESLELFDNIIDGCVDILLVGEGVVHLHRPHELDELAPEKGPEVGEVFRFRP